MVVTLIVSSWLPPRRRCTAAARQTALALEGSPEQELDLPVEAPQVVRGPLLQGIEGRGVEA
jgi:hypothetical protein